MKIKTSELTGAVLNWAVAKCEGRTIKELRYNHQVIEWLSVDLTGVDDNDYRIWNPSKDWEQGGPLIERERISVSYQGSGWEAVADEIISISAAEFGPTPLVAAMRCYVASKLGNEVEIPEKLL